MSPTATGSRRAAACPQIRRFFVIPKLRQLRMAMFRNKLYYNVKPWLPWKVRIAMRRYFAASQRRHAIGTWPIAPETGKPPADWPGWPAGKQFALVLTHDVERREGLERCRQLMELEIELGFRSSFNFVPEGDYETPNELREELIGNGFEVGVHDLHHNGRLYTSYKTFHTKAARIKHYLKEWNAVGFRSAFMMRNLDWLHDLNVLYDASTFDTDPFEPQPDGTHTIFPFWVPRPASRFDLNYNVTPASEPKDFSVSASQCYPRSGYVELPYTLPQDSTVFVLMRERTIDIWKQKLDWIASHGGMALINVHPDYVSFNDTWSSDKFPLSLYREFLEYVSDTYSGRFWSALPREVAGFVVKQTTICKRRVDTVPAPTSRSKSRGRTVWIDLDNTPHVPFFRPIIRELEKAGYTVAVSARDAYQVCELADHYGVKHARIGRHYGRNPFLKVAGTFLRSVELLPFALRHRPCLALSHGSRSQIIASNLLGLPSMFVFDYEFAKGFPFSHPTWAVAPTAVAESSELAQRFRLLSYGGIKEDVYAPEFQPDDSIISRLGLNLECVLVAVRPPASEAHYHSLESDRLFEAFMERVCGTENVQAVVLPRNKRQEAEVRQRWAEPLAAGRIVIPAGSVDGLNLLWHCDLTVSGGGTMNREAAALGVPVYSIFRGKIGAVDRQLSKDGRLILVESVEDVRVKINLKRREKVRKPNGEGNSVLCEILNHIERVISHES